MFEIELLTLANVIASLIILLCAALFRILHGMRDLIEVSELPRREHAFFRLFYWAPEFTLIALGIVVTGPRVKRVWFDGSFRQIPADMHFGSIMAGLLFLLVLYGATWAFTAERDKRIPLGPSDSEDTKQVVRMLPKVVTASRAGLVNLGLMNLLGIAAFVATVFWAF